MKCEHHACRCAQAAELARIYDRTGRGADLQAAINVHHQWVPCILVSERPIRWERGGEVRERPGEIVELDYEMAGPRLQRKPE